ncbi:MAG: sulfatase-like hydrolase/transferase [Akkermansiaceae bacterium]|nr:sulfatase-like hydrolase/transferase [Akkermansiaceae bacterium]
MISKLLLRGLLTLTALISLSLSADAAGKPNILFLFTDDQSFETLHGRGYEDIQIPNLDRLSQAGTTFTHAYNMGAWHGAVCVASRTMLMTGRTVWRAKGIEPKLSGEATAGRLWPQLLAKAGYRTYLTGKWHVQVDPAKVFNEVRNVRAGMPSTKPAAYNRPLEGKPDPWSASDPEFGGFWTGGKHWSEVAGDDAVDFIQQSKDSDPPFFMVVAFNAPHDPRQSPKEYVEKYPLDRIKVPESFLPLYPHRKGMGCGKDLRDEQLAPFPRTRHAVKVHRQEYHAIISHLDTQIGRILDALEKSGLKDNTWIFLTSDHGLAIGHHGLFGKQNMYDHSLRVPFLVAGPGVKHGASVSAPIYLQDLMATTLEIAGVEKPEAVEFRSLLPLLRDPKAGGAREVMYGTYMNLQRAIIHNGWKLILYPKIRVAKLYHLTEDPDEMADLSKAPAHQARLGDLFKRLLAQQQELGDELDLRATYPDL